MTDGTWRKGNYVQRERPHSDQWPSGYAKGALDRPKELHMGKDGRKWYHDTMLDSSQESERDIKRVVKGSGGKKGIIQSRVSGSRVMHGESRKKRRFRDSIRENLSNIRLMSTVALAVSIR